METFATLDLFLSFTMLCFSCNVVSFAACPFSSDSRFFGGNGVQTLLCLSIAITCNIFIASLEVHEEGPLAEGSRMGTYFTVQGLSER